MTDLSELNTHSFYLAVRSEDARKLVPGKTTAIEVDIDPPLFCERGEEFTMRVQSLYIPYSFYNVNDGNNKFDFYYDEIAPSTFNTSFTVTIDPGNWNLANLLADMESQVRGATGNAGISISLNRNVGKLFFAVDATHTCVLQIKMDTGPNATKQSRQIMGLNTDLSVLSGTSAFGNNVASILTIPRICLRSDVLDTNSYDTASATASNELAEIIVDVPLFTMLTYVPTRSRYVSITPTILSTIQFSITDPDYNLVDLNGLEWSVVIAINRVKRAGIDPQVTEQARNDFVSAQLNAIDIESHPPMKRPRPDVDVTDMTDANRINQTVQSINADKSIADQVQKNASKRDDIPKTEKQKKEESKKIDEKIDQTLNLITP